MILVSPRRIAALFAVIATIFVLIVARTLPPIQGPDEGAHLARADMISHGQLLAHRIGETDSGGLIDLGVVEAIARFYPILMSQRSPDRSLYGPVAWGAYSRWSFPNTAVYPPLFYLPAAAALAVGRHNGLDVLHSLIEARVASGLVSVGIATVAIALAGPTAIVLFALLLLPSSVTLMACVTQDGPMLACTALAAALLLQAAGPTYRRLACGIVAALLLALIGACRPPYLALLSLVLIVPALSIATRRMVAAISLLPALAWCGWCALYIYAPVDRSFQANAGAQALHLLTHPWTVPALLVHSFAADFPTRYAGFFITTFTAPGSFELAAYFMLAVSLAAAVAIGGLAPGRRAFLVAATLLVTVAGLFMLQYLTWTPVGSPAINGVLGRYFLPIAILLPLACCSPIWRRPHAALLALPVLAFPVISLLVSVRDLLIRYYQVTS